MDTGKLVFLDECGVNTNMARLYARAKGGERAHDGVPLNTGISTTILSSVRLDGECIAIPVENSPTKRYNTRYGI